MNDAQQLLDAVRPRTEGTPYQVTPTERGFDVGIDFPDWTWHRLLFDHHVEKAWTFHVAVDEPAKSITITDEELTVTWEGGGSRAGIPVPVIQRTSGRTSGRIQEISIRKTIALDGTASPAPSDYRFNSWEARNLIREPARELGWTEKMPGAEKVGLAVAVATVVLLVIAGVAVAVVALTVGL